MHRRSSFESLLISEGSLFTFPAAAGQINRLERVASLYTHKTIGPVGIKNLGGKVIKTAFINTLNPSDAVMQRGAVMLTVISPTANS